MPTTFKPERTFCFLSMLAPKVRYCAREQCEAWKAVGKGYCRLLAIDQISYNFKVLADKLSGRAAAYHQAAKKRVADPTELDVPPDGAYDDEE